MQVRLFGEPLGIALAQGRQFPCFLCLNRLKIDDAFLGCLKSRLAVLHPFGRLIPLGFDGLKLAFEVDLLIDCMADLLDRLRKLFF